MAYRRSYSRRRTTSGRSYSRSRSGSRYGYRPRKRVYRRGRTGRTGAQTLRIVVEQPTAPTSLGARELIGSKPADKPKKARF